jgi:hypothetical protein
MCRAIAAFWRVYQKEVALDEQVRRTFIERALLCAAARLIQSAIEVMHGQPRPSPDALSLLAASIEVTTNTREIARRLGLDEDDNDAGFAMHVKSGNWIIMSNQEATATQNNNHLPRDADHFH